MQLRRTAVAAGACLAGVLASMPFAAAQTATQLPVEASSTTPDANALAKQLANPISSLVSVPMQLNFDDGLGDGGDGDRYLLNAQPVIPVSINDHWNMISRTIVPIISQDGVTSVGSQSGLGDVTQSLFFSPKALTAGGWTWGVGPVFLIPTATDDVLGSKKWGAGPTAVALKQSASGWTVGILANHIWSFGGDSERSDVNATYLQPFVAKSLGRGRTATLAAESTYDWERAQWTVPLILSYSRVSRIGQQLVSYQGGVRYYVESPEDGPDWGLRFTLTLLYPRH